MKRLLLCALVVMALGTISPTHAAGVPTPFAALRSIILPRLDIPSVYLAYTPKATGSNVWGNGVSSQMEQFNLPVGTVEGAWGQRIAITVIIFPSVQEAHLDITGSHTEMKAKGFSIFPGYDQHKGDMGPDAFLAITSKASPGHSGFTAFWRRGFIECVWTLIGDVNQRDAQSRVYDYAVQHMDKKMRWVASWQVPVAQY